MRSIKLIAAFAALALVPAAAHAQTTLTACYVQKSGTVYRIKVEGAPGKCAPNHVEFSWSVGTIGVMDISDLEIVEESYTSAPGETFFKGAFCPAGKLAMNGGYRILNASTSVAIVTNNFSMIGFGWSVAGVNTGANPETVVILATCVPYQS